MFASNDAAEAAMFDSFLMFDYALSSSSSWFENPIRHSSGWIPYIYSEFPIEWIPSISLENTTLLQLKMDGDNFFLFGPPNGEKKPSTVSSMEKRHFLCVNERHAEKQKKEQMLRRKKKRKLKIAFINYTLTLKHMCVFVSLCMHATSSHTNLHPFRLNWMSWNWIELNWSQKCSAIMHTHIIYICLRVTFELMGHFYWYCCCYCCCFCVKCSSRKSLWFTRNSKTFVIASIHF